MKDLVEFSNNDYWTNSSLIARKFGLKHRDVVDTILKIIDRLNNLRVVGTHPKTESFESTYRGTKFTAYKMNREFFSLLAMRFTTERAFEWQVKFNSAFYEMEKRIMQQELNSNDPGWKAVREQGKSIRKAETDVIKQFVDYAIEQGSKSANKYYIHITNSTYKCLGLIQHKKPKLRDTLSGLELGWIISAEHVAQQSLLKHMSEGEHYKKIFKLVQKDLENFAKNLMIPALEDAA